MMKILFVNIISLGLKFFPVRCRIQYICGFAPEEPRSQGTKTKVVAELSNLILFSIFFS